MPRKEFERKVKKVQITENNDDILLQPNNDVNQSFKWHL